MKVTIRKIEPQEDKISLDGNPYRKQDVVVGWQEDAGNGVVLDQQVILSLLGDTLATFESKGCKVGDEVDALLLFRTQVSAKTGRLYNSISVMLLHNEITNE